MSGLPWLVGGDFNEIVVDSEKQGGRARPLVQINLFRETLMYCNLHEVAHPDRSMTWCNRREEGMVFERLDRFVGNNRWAQTFPNTSTKCLDFYGSDHRPIFCTLEDESRIVISKVKGRFHFEEKWFLDKGFVPDFLCEWADLHYVGDMTTKLMRCEQYLKKWAGRRWDKLGKQVSELRKKRQKMMDEVDGKWSAEDFLGISRQIEDVVEAEACHWKQRARVNWLANGDRNTGAFHARALIRRKKNNIKGLEDAKGEWQEDEKTKA